MIGAFPKPVRENSRAVLAGACAAPAAIVFAVVVSKLGPLSWQMALHIVTMNVAAPLFAVVLNDLRFAPGLGRPRALWALTCAQLIVLWAVHSPAAHHHLHHLAGHILLHTLLLTSAVAFWISVAAIAHRWQAILALLISGKLACLLGALLIFAPRLVLVGQADHHATHSVTSLTDQQLAGLLMIAACPLSYVLPAIVLAVQAVYGLEDSYNDPVPGELTRR